VIALAILLAAYSVVGALVLALTHFAGEAYRDQAMSRAMGLVLLLALAALQLAHFAELYAQAGWVGSVAYRIAIFSVAPSFYLFARPLLKPQVQTPPRPVRLGHLLPLLVSPGLPDRYALPLAFVVGAGYLLWLARDLYALRRERARFGAEMLLLGGVFVVAIAASVLGLLQLALPGQLFLSLYASAIGLALLLVQLALGLKPQLPVEVRETAREAYASSTLNHVDCAAALARLDRLMSVDRVYADPELSLPVLAERLGLSTHQLSELVNSKLGKSFSRYLREQRVAAAKIALSGQPSASVLSVGLGVGFTSQSNFYEAFREIEGTTPGAYRKLALQARAERRRSLAAEAPE
jgi:AraC-like DNA-binding protein